MGQLSWMIVCLRSLNVMIGDAIEGFPIAALQVTLRLHLF
jgi:hypothetical protein